MDKRKTCHGCEHLACNQIVMSALIWHCTETEFVIPHASERLDNGEWKSTFWRVPMACPLPDDQVLKSEKQAPKRDWVEITA